MNIRILDEAQQDLIDGFQFYERKEAGLGGYFLDSLFADIDSLQRRRNPSPGFQVSPNARQALSVRCLLPGSGASSSCLRCAGLPSQPSLDPKKAGRLKTRSSSLLLAPDCSSPILSTQS